MAGLVPAIHVLLYSWKKDVDARDERGHDEAREVCHGESKTQDEGNQNKGQQE
jgi:hypothetical protein